MGPTANLTQDELFAVTHANQLHVFGGNGLFSNESVGVYATQRPPEGSVLAMAMANRCPLTYCQQTPKPKD